MHTRNIYYVSRFCTLYHTSLTWSETEDVPKFVANLYALFLRG